MIAPTLGGWLLTVTSWRGVFGALALFGLVLIRSRRGGCPRTLPPQRRQATGIRATLTNYRRLLHDGTFIGLILVAGLAVSALIAYVAGSSFVFQQQFGLSQQQFGLAFGSGAIWLILATQLNPVLLRRLSRRLLLAAIASAFGFGLLLLRTHRDRHRRCARRAGADLAGAVQRRFALPNAPAVALARHGEAAGTAAALLGAVSSGPARWSPVVGLLGNDSVAMGTVIATGLALSLLVLLVVVRPWR